MKTSFLIVLFFAKWAFAADTTEPTLLKLSDIADPIPYYLNQNPSKSIKKDSRLEDVLLQVELQYRLDQFTNCSKTLSAIKGKLPKHLSYWVNRKKLICDLESSKAGSKNVKDLSNSLAIIIKSWEDAPSYIQNYFKEPIFEATEQSFRLLKRSNELWSYVDFFKDNQSQFNANQLARIFHSAGDLARTERKTQTALQLYLLAYKQSQSSSLREKILAINKSAIEPVKDTPKANEESISLVEKETHDDFMKQYKLSNYLSSIDNAVTYLKKYPEGQWANDVADKVARIYSRLAANRSDSLVIARKKAISKMAPAPEPFLYDWSRSMFFRERYEDVISLLKPYVDSVADHSTVSAKILLQLGLSALHSGAFSESRNYFQMIVDKHAGSEDLPEALFRLGLLNYRLKKFPQATEMFNKYLDTQKGGDFEVSSMYWAWRSLEQYGKDQAIAARKRLIDEYPLSYFGLRAAAEAGDIKSILASDPKRSVSDVSLLLSENNKAAWAALQILMKASWLGEAEVEIDALASLANEPKAQVFMSKLYRKAYLFIKASKWMWPALRADPSLRIAENVEVVFPRLFADTIQTNVSRYDLNNYLIRGLIRQESSYNVRAYSSAGAAGLMQILRPTAQEIARDLRMKGFSARRDLFDPVLNIKIGVNYVYRLNRAFEGNIALALASYNAGIGNIKGWLKNRQDLEVQQMSGSNPDSEMWIEELPWLETTGYVKNVQRNWLVYNLLDDPKTKVAFPIK